MACCAAASLWWHIPSRRCSVAVLKLFVSARRRAVSKVVGAKNAPTVVTLGFIALW